MWDFPGPEIEPMFPALAGGFFTTEPPGKPSSFSSGQDEFEALPVGGGSWVVEFTTQSLEAVTGRQLGLFFLSPLPSFVLDAGKSHTCERFFIFKKK